MCVCVCVCIYIYIYIYIYLHNIKNTCNVKHNNKFCCSISSNVSAMNRKRNLLLVHPPTNLSVFLTPVNYPPHYATNRQVACLIPDGVIGIFQWHNPSGRTMALGVNSASNRNEYQVYFLGVKAAGAWGWQPYHHPVPLPWNLGTLTSWNPLGHSRPATGLLYLLN